MVSPWGYILLVLYLAAAGLYYLFFFDYKEREALVARAVLIVLLTLHLGLIVIHSLATDRPPLASRAEALSVTAWCLGAMYLAVEVLSRRAEFGGFVMSLAAALQFLSLLHKIPAKVPPALDNPGFVMHAWMNIMAYSGFFLSFLFSILYLVMRSELKAHNPGWLSRRLPSMQTLDIMSAHSTTVGFVLLTAGLIAGAFWAKSQWGYFFKADPKLLASVAVWLIYGAYMLVRAFRVGSYRLLAFLSVFGFCAIIFSFVLVHGLGQSVHRF